MEERIVRLAAVSISNIKNVKNGTITFRNSRRKQFVLENSKIIGIYGQNGTGKTAVIDALFHLKKIMTGEPLEGELAECMDINAQQAEIAADFDILLKGRILEAGYKVVLRRVGGHVEISQESISCAINVEGARTNKRNFADFHRDDKETVFTPVRRFREVMEYYDGDDSKLRAAKKEAEKSNCSYIFGKEGRKIFCREYENEFRECSAVVKALFLFALKNLLVIRDSRSGIVSADFIWPIMNKKEKSVKEMKESPALSVLEPLILDEEKGYLLEEAVEQMNTVLYTIIPGMKIEIRECGKPAAGGEAKERCVELVSVRDDRKEIPLRMESGGIKKLVSILNALIQGFGNPSVCLAIDELDTGIFEYMLDELLIAFKDSAKGQMIFTAHNLRALKVLDRNNIIFSSTDADNRYIRIKNLRETDDLYDIYMESVASGSPEEAVYQATNSIRIAGEFRKAGRRVRREMPEGRNEEI